MDLVIKSRRKNLKMTCAFRVNRQRTTLWKVLATVDVTTVVIPPVVVTVVARASDRDLLADDPTLQDVVIVSTTITKIGVIVMRTIILGTIAVTVPTRDEASVLIPHLPCTTRMRVQICMALLRYRTTTETIEAVIPRGVPTIWCTTTISIRTAANVVLVQRTTV
jgi:hypothetical protein